MRQGYRNGITNAHVDRGSADVDIHHDIDTCDWQGQEVGSILEPAAESVPEISATEAN